MKRASSHLLYGQICIFLTKNNHKKQNPFIYPHNRHSRRAPPYGAKREGGAGGRMPSA
jgi:hypothetical protein